MKDQFFHQHETISGRKFHKFREYLFTARNDSKLLLSAFCLQYTDCINLPVLQERKRLTLSYNCRRKKRQDFRIKEHFQIRTLLYTEAVKIYHADTCLFQLVHQCLISCIFALIQLADGLENLLDLFLWCHIGFIFTHISG